MSYPYTASDGEKGKSRTGLSTAGVKEQHKETTTCACLSSFSAGFVTVLLQLQQNCAFAKVNVGWRMRKISEPSDTWWRRNWMQSRNAVFGQEMVLH